jgi:predicted DCC family thiol-disulfide oxidoreductase YuxK
MKLIKKLYDKKISGFGLSIFRIAYSLVLLAEICQFYFFRHLMFDKIPYIEKAEISFEIPIAIWGIAVFFILIGLFTRTASIINYLMTVILIGTIGTYEYHVFSVYCGVNFLLMFLPVSRNLSLDRLLVKYKYSNARFTYNPPTEVSVLAYYVPVFVAIALIYFDSVFFKFASPMWQSGLGLWLPSAIPQTAFIPLNWLMNQKYLVIGLGYLTLLFETVFLFTFFRKKWRVPLLIIGMGLHIGILVCYPIPWFALGMCSLYLLMVPVSWWEKLFGQKKENAPKMTFYYDGECPLCNRTKITVQHFDRCGKIDFKTVQYFSEQDPLLNGISQDDLLNNVHSVRNGKVYKGIDTYIQVLDCIWCTKPLGWLLRIPGIYHLEKKVYVFIAKNRNTERCTEENCGYTPPAVPPKEETLKILQNYTLKDLKTGLVTTGLSILILLQIIVSYNSPVPKQLRAKIGLENNFVNRTLEEISSTVANITSTFLGITRHGVFLDGHFRGYDHLISVVYSDKKSNQEIWLPITDKDGTPGDYLWGTNWAKWTFRVNNPYINQGNLEKGIRDFTAFWAAKNGIDLNDATFIIKLKKVETTNHWEKDFLKRQMEQPWQDIGVAVWKGNQYSIQLPEVEKL